MQASCVYEPAMWGSVPYFEVIRSKVMAKENY